MQILSELGERKIVSEILKMLEDSPRNILGRVDDAAIYDLGFNKHLVVSIDRIPLPYGITFGLLDFEGMGKYFACSTINDVIVKGAKPFAMLVSLGVPKDMTLKQLRSLLKGLHSVASKYGITVIGGDTKPKNSLDLVGTVLGLIDKGFEIPRNGSSSGDIVAITGEIGLFTAFLCAHAKQSTRRKIKMLIKELKDEYNRRLEVPFALMRIISRMKSACASIDISDGLYGDLKKISELSEVGMEIFTDKIPFPIVVPKLAKELDIPTEIFAAFGGDLQLALVIERKKWRKTVQEITQNGLSLHCIGRVVSGSNVTLLKNRKRCKLNKIVEWDLFSKLNPEQMLSEFQKQLKWT